MDIDMVKEECTTIDDFDEAIIGTTLLDDGMHAVYSAILMVQILVNRDSMTVEEALEYIDYNVVRALVYYPPSPIIVDILV
jgi:hypothetical protein